MVKKEAKLLINPQEVSTAFLDCLFKAEELEGTDGIPRGAVLVEGVVHKFRFHPDRLESKRAQVIKWLKALPHVFRSNNGGGWSFLNACNQENGIQWTDLHQQVEQLFCLAMGLGLARCQVPREVYQALPGGMPYYVIFVE